MKPGHRLRELARRICAADTLERIVDPLIADLQFEHGGAVRAGRPWRARLRLLAGYLGFWKAIGVCATRAVICDTRRRASADDHAMGRTLAYSAATIAGLMLLLALLPFPRLNAARSASMPAHCSSTCCRRPCPWQSRSACRWALSSQCGGGP